MTLPDLRPVLEKWKQEPNLRVCTWVDRESALELFLEALA
jgi:hypothetical protein